MSELIKRLQERRANVWEQTKALLDAAETEGRGLSAEEDETYQRLTGDLDQIDARVKDMTEAEQRAADAEAAFGKLLARPQTEDRKAPVEDSDLRRWARGEIRSFEVAPSEEARDLVKGTPTAGGHTVPTTFYGQLIEHLIEVSGVMMAGPTVINTSSGENIDMPVTTAHTTAALVAEGGTIPEADPAFAKRTLGAYKYGDLLQISSELLTDSAFNLEEYLSRTAGRALGNAFGAHAILGTGTNQPTGVVTSATSGKTGAGAVAGAFTADDLIDLYYSVIAPYRNSTSCAWLMRDATMGAVRKLKDQQGQYLWQPSIQVGVPDTLLGKPVHTDPNVAAVGTGAKSVVFGDFSQYAVRMAGGVRFERSDSFAFNTDLVTYRAIIRADGVTLDQTGAIKVFTGGAAS
ncbi:phage major capsid protein [Streptomyces albidoflavus]|uniref:phage major capsid protein n=1 Tax=Streptomyces albidoflavus TaxID=1886 RepID=UPI003405D546